MRIDAEGEPEWIRQYQIGDIRNSDRCSCIQRLTDDDDDMIVVGGYATGKMLYVNRDGDEQWRREYNIVQDFDVHGFKSVVQGRDGSIVAAGLGISPDSTHANGFLIKYSPEVFEPEFLFWSPEDTMQTVLIGDSLQFIVRMRDQQGDSLIYRWFMNEDTLSDDTTETVVFDELGNFDVQCQVSDGNNTVTITWHVTVCEWYIRTFSPDNLDFAIRRGTEVEFTIDVVSIENIELDYLWTLTEQNHRPQEIGDRDSVTVGFDLAREYRLMMNDN